MDGGSAPGCEAAIMRRAVEGACERNRPPLRLARGWAADGPSGLRTGEAVGRVSGWP